MKHRVRQVPGGWVVDASEMRGVWPFRRRVWVTVIPAMGLKSPLVFKTRAAAVSDLLWRILVEVTPELAKAEAFHDFAQKLKQDANPT